MVPGLQFFKPSPSNPTYYLDDPSDSDPTTSSPVAPTDSKPTTHPVDPNVSGCCSQDYLTCNVNWCGGDKAGCDVYAQWANYYWMMADGPPAPGGFVGSWGGCTNGEAC